jgi:hypothetical protein
MRARKISTTIYLSEEQLTNLRALSLLTGKPMAAMIRDAIDNLLRTHPPVMPDARAVSLDEMREGTHGES